MFSIFPLDSVCFPSSLALTLVLFIPVGDSHLPLVTRFAADIKPGDDSNAVLLRFDPQPAASTCVAVFLEIARGDCRSTRTNGRVVINCTVPDLIYVSLKTDGAA